MAMVKICGAITPSDVELLAASGADLVGLWYGIPGGHADLSVRELSSLAAVTRITNRVRPVLVTFLSDPDVLRGVVERTGVRWVQLHGYQPPALVRTLKEADELDLTVVKVLHVKGDECVERPLIKAYERAGTDFFLLDAATDSGRVGSTGQRLDSSIVLDLANQMTRPFMLAGGISHDNSQDYRAVVEHPLFLGVDVDTAARDSEGRFRTDRVSAIRHTWQNIGARAGVA